MKERKKENAWGLVWFWWLRMDGVGIKRERRGDSVLKGNGRFPGNFFALREGE